MDSQLPDYDAVYRGEIPEMTAVPWNIGEPQPALAEAIDSGALRSPVLDAGCGIGVTSRYLADRGYEVVGVDAAPAAIAQAQSGPTPHGLHFEVADVTQLQGYDGHFASIIDSTLFHSMPVQSRTPYLASIARAAQRPGTLHMLVFDRAAGFPDDAGPNAVDAEELRAAVSPHWTIDSIEPSTIRAYMPPDWGTQFPLDDKDRRMLPAFLLTAHLG